MQVFPCCPGVEAALIEQGLWPAHLQLKRQWCIHVQHNGECGLFTAVAFNAKDVSWIVATTLGEGHV